MQREFNDFDFDQFTQRLIHKKAQQLVRKSGFTPSDREDIEQNLKLKLLKNMDAFDPSQGHWNVFVTAIVERCAANLVRDTKAQKRHPHRACSLNVVIVKHNRRVIELGDTIDSQAQDTRLGCRRRSDLEQSQFVQDITDVIAELPLELRELAENLMSDSVSKISGDKGISRSTLNSQIRRLRKQFEQAGLADYL